MTPVIARLQGATVPFWAKWLAIAALAGSTYGVGRLQEARRGADVVSDYIGRQAVQSSRIAQAQAHVVTVTETKWRDRIKVVYQEGKQIEERVPQYIPPDVDRRLPMPTGLVRVLDAAWAGNVGGPAGDFDGEPSTVPASVVAANEVDNATSCRVWREQALGWRAFYAGQQVAVNGKAGMWATGVVLPETMRE